MITRLTRWSQAPLVVSSISGIVEAGASALFGKLLKRGTRDYDAMRNNDYVMRNNCCVMCNNYYLYVTTMMLCVTTMMLCVTIMMP